MIPDDLAECLNQLCMYGGIVEDWLTEYAPDDERKRKMLLVIFLRRLALPGNEKFFEEFELIREFGEKAHQILAEDALYKQAISGEKNHFRAVQTLLERRNPGRWSKVAEKKGEKIDASELADIERSLMMEKDG